MKIFLTILCMWMIIESVFGKLTNQYFIFTPLKRNLFIYVNTKYMAVILSQRKTEKYFNLLKIFI